MTHFDFFSGHQRPLTQIKFNADGDLLFSSSKDLVINVWFSHNGERLGTYEGHNGSVWTVDVDRASSLSLFFPSFLLEVGNLTFNPSGIKILGVRCC